MKLHRSALKQKWEEKSSGKNMQTSTAEKLDINENHKTFELNSAGTH